jgi:peptide/nickel transport system substrate-binding protein
MKKLRWQLLVVILSLVAIGFLLLGQQPERLPGGEPEIEPVRGGVYTEALVGTPLRLNPMLDYYNQVDYDVDRLIFCSLVSFDHRGLPFGNVADSWGISIDGTRYSFSIRDDAVWHDGEPVTSKDVIFTIESLRSEDTPMPPDVHEFWQQVEVFESDEKTISFELPEPFAPFLDYLTFGLLPEHLLGHLYPDEIIDDAFNLNPVGCGPYKFDQFVVEDGDIMGVVLLAFDDYYAQKAYIDQLVFRYYADAASALFAYKQGDVMGINQVPPSVLSEALIEPDLKLFSARLPRLSLVYLNLDLPEMSFFQEIEVRRALLSSINRRWIVDRLLGGQAIIAHGPIFPESWANYEDVEQLAFDREYAIEVLKDAGYTIPAEGGWVRAKDDVRLSFEMVHPDVEPYPEIAQKIQENWRQIGVDVSLESVPYQELLEDYLEPREYEAALVELNLARSPDPDPYPFWHQTQISGGQNYAGWDDRQASEYLERARVKSEIEERTRLYRNFQFRFSQELPALLLFYPVYTYSLDNQVQAVSVGPLYDPSDRFDTITEWFLLAGVTEPDTPEPPSEETTNE